jgi:hypothetical protein
MNLRHLLLAAALLITATSCSRIDALTERAQPVPPAPNAEKASAPAGEAEQALFEELVAFVEATRGFTFETLPTLSVVEPGKIDVDDLYGDDEWVAIDESRFHALGILDRDTDYLTFLDAWSNSSFIGYYDPATDEMVVTATDAGWGPAVQATIVHELVHAVQERRGELTRADKIWQVGGAEASDVFDALLEGEATLLEDLYTESLPARARWLRWEEESALAGEPGPPNSYFDYTSYYPYDIGVQVMTAAFDAGGWDAVDALFDDPPSTTEQLEYPEAPTSAYEELIEVPDLTVRGFDVVEEEQWGKNNLDAYLLNALPPDESTSWADDWYRLHWDGTTAVIVHHLRGDDQAATNRMAVALIAHCENAELGEGFTVLRKGPDAAFVASVDRSLTQAFTTGLAEHGYTVTGTC